MIWLLEEAPDAGDMLVMIRLDSYYAANVAMDMWVAKGNEEFADRAIQLTEKGEGRRVITWRHVCGHTGEHGNELTDRAADAGCKGRVAEQSRIWTMAPPEMARPRAEMAKRYNIWGQEFRNHM